MRSAWKALLAAGCLAGPAVVTFLADRVDWRSDWTAEGIYTVSGPTRDLLRDLPSPVTLSFFFTPETEGIPVPVRNFADRVETMLRRFGRAAPAKISVETVEPRPDTPAEERAIAAGLSGQRMANGDTLYFGLVAESAAGERAIPFFFPAREPVLEYDLARLLLDLGRGEKPKVGIVTSLDLWGTEADPITGRKGEPASLLVRELRRLFEVVRVRGPELPGDLDLLALLHPRGVGGDFAFAIDQYFLGGGPLLVALDPSSAEIRRTRPDRAGMAGLGGPTQSDLPDLLRAWGIDYDPRQVVGDFERATPVRLSPADPEIRHPVWLTIREPGDRTPATTGLEEILLVEPGSFAVENPELRVTPILETSRRSGEMMASAIPYTPVENIPDQIQPDGRSELLAALVQGVFPSAFPDGPPTDDEMEAWINELNAGEGKFLRESAAESDLLLVADSDLFVDRFGAETVRYLNQTATRRSNDNLALAVNLFDFLAGGNELLELRGKGTASRPFLRVERLAARAREDYEKQLERLEKELRAVREDIRRLEEKEDEKDEADAGEGTETEPEEALASRIEERIQAFREEESRLRQERREIRRALREEIRALDRTLALLNLFVVPGLVAVTALAYFARRKL